MVYLGIQVQDKPGKAADQGHWRIFFPKPLSIERKRDYKGAARRIEAFASALDCVENKGASRKT